MQNKKKTLAVYGIQDIKNTPYPIFCHDHGLVVMNEGKIEYFLQLERKTRIKYDNKLHVLLTELLREKKYSRYDLFDLVSVDNVIGRAFITQDGKIRLEAPLVANLKNYYENAYCNWYGEKVNGYIVNHELTHIYSCVPFYGPFKENSLLIHFDGGASKSNFSAWLYRDNSLTLLQYDWELISISSLFNANALLFFIIGGNLKNQNSVPGKIMGLASYGTYKREIEDWLVTNNYFQNIWSKKTDFFQRLYDDWRIILHHFDTRHQFIQDIAATCQYIFQRELLHRITNIQTEVQADYLWLTGGSALNIKANSSIIEAEQFKNVYIPPCTNDTGLALGAGALFEEQKHGSIFFDRCPYLNNWGIETYQVSYNENDIAHVAELLRSEQIIGICNGYGEIGPRALGNRSIISIASSKSIAKKVSQGCKRREWYRPLAPIMLEHNVKYFTGLDYIHHLSKYMLLEFKIKPELQGELEGAVHVDGTARIQTLFDREFNPFMYDLLSYLDRTYNIKALINTSFNQSGEPLVHTIDDAKQTGRSMGLDALILNGAVEKL